MALYSNFEKKNGAILREKFYYNNDVKQNYVYI